jgi:hypothetical protein
MDRILTTLIADYLSSQELEPGDVGIDFEQFAIYSIISHEYNRDFEIDQLCTGKGNDTGIDGIGIIVNGQLIESIEDIDFLLKENGYLEVTFIFIQAKAESKFDSAEMGVFSFGVIDFFSENPRLVRNEKIKEFAAFSTHLFSHAANFRINPIIKLFYISTGTWLEDQNNVAVMKSTIEQLKSTNLFSDIEFFSYGSKEISDLYRESKTASSTTFIFSEKITLPELPDIGEAYYGILPFSEFKKIIVDENKTKRPIYYDNIRDFYGLENRVNTSIVETLKSESPQLFTVLNNGVTIVATSLISSGNRFTISDFQIVNGCQTSNVLFAYKDSVPIQELFIPVKLIITVNDGIKNLITVATNNQNAVKREQLQAMTEFQKRLEQFYETFNDDARLYYERRPKQYQSENIPKTRIISIQLQIKTFGAIFLDIPHLVTSYFGNVIGDYVENEPPLIFSPSHQFYPYFISSYMYYKLDSLFRMKLIDNKYRKIKLFILMLASKLIGPINPKSILESPKRSELYCQEAMKLLCAKDNGLSLFMRAIEIIEVSGLDVHDKEILKKPSTTEQLLKIYKEKYLIK